MSYITFDKNQLINLEYSLGKELIRSNRAGAYGSMTIICCNTRKYHGLLVAPQPGIDAENHVLLSALDETVIQHDAEFNLAIHKYPGGVYHPKGHKYIRDFVLEPMPYLIYRVGGVVLKKEMVLMGKHNRALIKYTLLDAHSPTTLRLRPFLAFRNVHRLSKANMDLRDKYEPVVNGIKMRLYPGYSPLYMQISKEAEYVHVPGWFYNIEYHEEMIRGYDYQEDLFVPGFFDVPMKKDEPVIFAAGTGLVNPKGLKRAFTMEVKDRIPRDSFENCLVNAARQFIVRGKDRTEMVAGFPWFGRWGRDTFIALPGLTLCTGDAKTCRDVLDTMVADLNGPLFPNVGKGDASNYHSIDAPLWFFWALQQYAQHTGKKAAIWKDYGKKMRMILNGYRDGTDFNIHMQDDGLIYGGGPGLALTWMDAVVDGKPVTPRTGLDVEINALWYNAIRFSIEAAEAAGNKNFAAEWQPVADRIPQSFSEAFYDREKGYLADVVDGDRKDFTVRPNQIFAVSLPYSPVSDELASQVVDTVQRELLTPHGLRTLSPKNPDYKGIYYGTQKQRDRAYHQGTAWPWLLSHFAEAYLKMHGVSGVPFVKELYNGFEEEMTEAGVGTISEVYDGDPPHKSGGAISQAWSVSELLRIRRMLEELEAD